MFNFWMFLSPNNRNNHREHAGLQCLADLASRSVKDNIPLFLITLYLISYAVCILLLLLQRELLLDHEGCAYAHKS